MVEEVYASVMESIKGAKTDERLSADFYTPSYGITKLTDVPFTKSKDGAAIVNNDPVISDKIRRLIDSYDIFRDKSIVPIPEKYKMRIDLVDG
ncbi:hypothetical protein DL768_005712 [Monosporascus sp. mg162]|nr:hypothetical protein DL768_005712 [Monosporascus sp. mg162]